MLRPERLFDLLAQRHISRTDFFNEIGFTRQTWNGACNGQDIGCSKIERVADYFNVPMDYFFDRKTDVTPNISGHTVHGIVNNVSGDIIIGQYEELIKSLKMLVDEKERTIQVLLEERERCKKTFQNQQEK